MEKEEFLSNRGKKKKAGVIPERELFFEKKIHYPRDLPLIKGNLKHSFQFPKGPFQENFSNSPAGNVSF